MGDRYRILFVGDASNYCRSLATGLARLGHEVTVASEGSGWMDTGRDIDLSRPVKGRLGGALLWLKAVGPLRRRLTGYDIVSVISTNFMKLKPSRLSGVFDMLRRGNGRVFNCMVGTDPYYIDACLAGNDYLRYNEWMVDGRPSPYMLARPGRLDMWRNEELHRLCEKIYAESAGTMSALYEYHMACLRVLPAAKVGYGGIPIDTRAIEYQALERAPRRVKFFLGRHRGREVEKGTDRLFTAARRVVEAHPERAELVVVENRPYNEYLQLLRDSQVVLDQLYSYTPATNALLAMAMGKTVVSGGEPEYYDFIGERELRPVINACPYDDATLYRQLEDIALHPERLQGLGRQGREFVERHNDVDVVASRYIDFWESRM